MQFLTPIDLAQTDQATNPATSFGRMQAKTDGRLYSRTSAGVEVALGGALQVVSAVLAADVSSVAAAEAVSGLSISIPPGRTAQILVVAANGSIATGTVAAPVGGGIQISNPAGSNGTVTGSVSANASPSASGAAAAGAVFDSDVLSLAAGSSIIIQATSSIIHANGVNIPYIATATIKNNSTNTSAIATAYKTSYGTGANYPTRTGSAIYAIIT